MNTKYFIAILFFVISCDQATDNIHSVSSEPSSGYSNADSAISMNESISGNSISSSAAVEKNTDPNRKFVRKAEIKSRVKNVVQTTYIVEDIITRNRGFVTLTELKSEISHTDESPISSDSSIINTHYTIVNNMVLRVPNTLLDTTLKEIARNFDFIDFRTISAEDVALQLLENNMTQSRIARNEGRLIKAIDQRGKKLEETTSAEELLLNKQEQSDQAKISNLSLNDQINYSTITLELYQRPAIKHEIVVNEKDIKSYQPNLFLKLWGAICDGWVWIENILVFLVRFWAIIAACILVYLGIKKYGHLIRK